MRMFAFIFALGLIVASTAAPQKPNSKGVTGRYCAKGAFNVNTGAVSGYDDDHYCGVHLIGELILFCQCVYNFWFQITAPVSRSLPLMDGQTWDVTMTTTSLPVPMILITAIGLV